MSQTQAEGRQLARPLLTPEERHELKDCSKEAFWYRVVPASAGGVLALHTMRRMGIMGPSGYAIKIGFTLFGCYMVGKASYASVCAARIMQKFPEGGYAQFLKEQKAGGASLTAHTIGQTLDAPHLPSLGQLTAGEQEQAGFDESRSDFAMPPAPDDSSSQERRTVSYDELRAANRAQYHRDQAARVSQQVAKQPSQQRRAEQPGLSDYPPLDDRNYTPPLSRPSPPAHIVQPGSVQGGGGGSYGDEGFS